METLDRNMQRRVWARVYPNQRGVLTDRQRQQLRRCLERSRGNLAVYEVLQKHGIYGEAFARMYAETAEHMKMLQQMLL